jgi:hypothetical protein
MLKSAQTDNSAGTVTASPVRSAVQTPGASGLGASRMSAAVPPAVSVTQVCLEQSACHVTRPRQCLQRTDLSLVTALLRSVISFTEITDVSRLTALLPAAHC